MKTFYNTTDLSGETLKKEEQNASTQEVEVIRFFNAHPGLHTPYDVLEGTNIDCINSVRRSMTNLTERGRLRKTDTKKKSGPYNKQNYCWTLSWTLF